MDYLAFNTAQSSYSGPSGHPQLRVARVVWGALTKFLLVRSERKDWEFCSSRAMRAKYFEILLVRRSSKNAWNLGANLTMPNFETLAPPPLRSWFELFRGLVQIFEIKSGASLKNHLRRFLEKSCPPHDQSRKPETSVGSVSGKSDGTVVTVSGKSVTIVRSGEVTATRWRVLTARAPTL